MLGCVQRGRRGRKPTSHDGSPNREYRRRQNEKHQEDPVRKVVNPTPDQCRYIIPAHRDEVGENHLHRGHRKDDRRRNNPVASPLLGRQGSSSVHSHLARQSPHDLKETDVEGRVESKLEVCLNVTPPVASKPLLHVVVSPDEGIDDGEEVEDHGDDTEDGAGELAAAEEETGWDPGDEEGDEAEEDAEEEVHLEGWVGVGLVGADPLFRGCCEAIERPFVEAWRGEFLWCWGCHVPTCAAGAREGDSWSGEVVE